MLKLVLIRTSSTKYIYFCTPYRDLYKYALLIEAEMGNTVSVPNADAKIAKPVSSTVGGNKHNKDKSRPKTRKNGGRRGSKKLKNKNNVNL